MVSSRRIFIKQIGFTVAGLGAMTMMPLTGFGKEMNGSGLPRSTPEEQGVSSAGILAFLNAVEQSKIDFHSIMIVRHGHVIAEGWWAPYGSDHKHTLYSLSKSFTSTAVGMAVGEGRLTVDDAVVSFFPNDLPAEVSANLSAMKVKHLLTMSTGHTVDTIPAIRNNPGKSWVKTFLEQPVDKEPGTHFLYNTGATYVAGAIVQKLTGQTLQEYLTPRLFTPLGITGMDWEVNAEGLNVGGYGLRVRTEDIAKFGLLYLQKGSWNGKQLLSPEWVEQATRKQVQSAPGNPDRHKSDNDWAQGYGYQFWRCRPGGYRADGAFGQFSMVMPDKDAVIAITSESFDLQKSMTLVWENLLPVMQDKALSSDTKSHKQLKDKLKNLSLATGAGKSSSSVVSKISGKQFTMDENELKLKKVSFTFKGDTCTLALENDKGVQLIKSKMNEWVAADKTVIFRVPSPNDVSTGMATRTYWSDDNNLVLTERFTETAHGDQITFAFRDNTLRIMFLNSVSKGNPNSQEKRGDIMGKMV